MTYRLRFSPASKQDLKLTYHYGLKLWGQKRAQSYLDLIENRLILLLEQPLIGSERAELQRDMRSLPTAQHIACYRISANCIEIIRVLHQKQDPGQNIS